MPELQELLGEIQFISKNPKKIFERHLTAGKKVVGCFPFYIPEAIVHAGGMLPFGLWGGQVTPAVAGKYSPAFTCSILRSCLEYGMTGTYKGLSCAVMPILCDSFRGTSCAWRVGVADIPLALFIYPQQRSDPYAKEFLAKEFNELRSRIEEFTGCSINDAAIQKSIEVYNQHAKAMMSFSEIANDHLDIVTPTVRHHVFKSAHFTDKLEHTALVQKLNALLLQRPVHAWAGKKIVLSGITAEPDEFLQLFEENNIAVVGDDLAQESRLYRTPIPVGDDPIVRLALQWFDRTGCSVIHEPNFTRGKMLVDMVKRTGADGIALCLMHYCDVEEYDYPLIMDDVREANIRLICLDIDQSTNNNEQSRTKIQGFAEITPA